MALTKIMIIRHAEKPSDDGSIKGVSASGGTDPEELTTRGWQRSGALVRFFAPLGGAFAHPALATPDVIFASGTAKHSNSLRPQHTVLALAQFLNKKLNLDHLKGDEDALVKDLLAQQGTVLVAWEHEAIPGIVGRIGLNGTKFPQKWPGERFDVAWVLDRQPGANGWGFVQVPQLLLSDDRAEAIS
jgi:hypothetical protein